MKTPRTARSRRTAWISSAALWAAALLVTGLLGGLWFLVAADSAGSAILVVAVLPLPATAGIILHQSRARARRRLQKALDAYAEREIAHAGRLRQKRRTTPVAATALPHRDRLSA
jgi:hypothetical protein